MKTQKDYFDFLFLLTEEAVFSKELADSLIALNRDPVAFYRQSINQEMSQRGLPDNADLYYLLDVLGEKKIVYECDWKADSEELNYALKWMSKGQIVEEFLSEEDEEDCEGMFELIDDVKVPLSKMGWALLEFPHDGDAHAIALVPLDKFEKLEAKMPF